MTIFDILNLIREQSNSTKEMGTKFERLIKNWFQTTYLYCNDIAEIWLWNDFPYRAQIGSVDTGIDIVAQTVNGEFWAIQCKFYSDKTSISKKDVDTFIATSNRLFTVNGQKVGFNKLFWVQSNPKNPWTSVAFDSIKNQRIDCHYIDINDLEASAVDWEAILDGHFGEKARLSPKTLMPHQQNALNHVHKYFIDDKNERGKLVMACGTGKTFTSLRIAEDLLGTKGLVLFLVPSLALMNQSLVAWKADAINDFNAVCVCSDRNVSKKVSRDDDTNSESIEELALPACTDEKSTAHQIENYLTGSNDKLTVVFSTYQSIEVIIKAQAILLSKGSLGVFDLVVCDEAHRTTGVKLPNSADESYFTKVHDNNKIKALRRLYMTATPKLYGEDVKNKASLNDCVLCSMDDENIYGKEIYHVGFSYAVEHNLLTDYKVLVLTVSEDDLPGNIREQVEDSSEKSINTDDTLKLIGILNGLSKNIRYDDGKTWQVDPQLMHRAMIFCPKIGKEDVPGSSKNIAHILPKICDMYTKNMSDEQKERFISLTPDTVHHVDGSMNTATRAGLIAELKDDLKTPNECRILTNVRCLSEGVDVPALDAVVFLSPKNSKVDVVQSVGRVMRNFRKGQDGEKKYGYIIIPVVCPTDTKPEDLLDNNERFKVVWDILNALRSHDESFNALINKIDLNRSKPNKVIVGPVGPSGGSVNGKRDGVTEGEQISNAEISRQLELRFGQIRDGIYARLVEKCGDRMYWENWAKSVGEIAQNFIARITKMVSQEGTHQERFNDFVKGLQKNLNPSIDNAQAIEMLAQHMITKPVFDALFGDYQFAQNNAVSHSMQSIIEYLESKGLEKDTEKLQSFYDSVKRNVGEIDNLAGKQQIIKTLYEKFFKTAFPKTVDKLGIVYTPVECVDFIIYSVEEILKKEFNRCLTDENVHILDPFTGTGTFITRLLQSGVIRPKDIERKYKNEIHCNEIVLLAYYVASINIESVFHEVTNRHDYLPYNRICLTDTFQLNEHGDNDIFSKELQENSDRVISQKKSQVRVIIGNPPYSVGQKNGNDNAQNLHYKNLEESLAATYAANSTATNKNSLYDSYIKAFRWASDRISSYEQDINDYGNDNQYIANNDGGIVAFITNGGWLDGNTQDGMRKCLEEEFSSIYVLNLRGGVRGKSKDEAKKEGQNVFDIMTGVCITFLVKNPKNKTEKAKIYYHDIGDYLTRKEKFAALKKFESIKNIEWQNIKPNDKYDWINQRDGVFDTFISLGNKDDKKVVSCEAKTFFMPVYSAGLQTNRDVWCYNSSVEELEENIKCSIDFYNSEVERFFNLSQEQRASVKVKDFINYDSTKFKWASSQIDGSFPRFVKYNFDSESFYLSSYRPFVKQICYFNHQMNHRTYQLPKLFPNKDSENLLICVSSKDVLITDKLPDLHFVGTAQCFPLYYYEEKSEQQGQLDLFSAASEENDSVRKDGITDWILNEFRTKLKSKSITKEQIFYYVYGLLHSEDYRVRFEPDLKKSLPRLPIVDSIDDFLAFYNAGKKLADLHLNYESVAPYKDVEVKFGRVVDDTDYDAFKVTKMSFIKKDVKNTIVFNNNIIVDNIPLKAYEYVVNGKSAIEWIMERYQVTVDKESLIKNDPNDWALEHQQPRYILDLLLSIINVSVQTVDIVKSLPKLEF